MLSDPDRVVWLSGMPRSGTTWVSQMFAAAPDVRVKFCPLFSYEFKNALDKQSGPADWARFFAEVFVTASPYMDQHHLRDGGLIPRFEPRADANKLVIKSNRFHHLMPQLLRNAPTVRLIYIVRHPAATLYSWLSHEKEFPQGADPMVEWRSGACRKTGVGEFWGFDDWKEVTRQALALRRDYPDRVRIQPYHAMTTDPVSEAEALFSFCGMVLGQETMDFIASSQARHDLNQRSVFKSPRPDDAWKTRLDPRIIESIEQDIRDTELSRFLEA